MTDELRQQPKIHVPKQLDSLTSKADFERLYNHRSTLKRKWEIQAGWTLPYIYPLENLDESVDMQNDYQSVGAQVVNHLANKIVSILFPQGKPFFRYDLSAEQKEQLAELDLDELQIEEVLSIAEKVAMKNLAKKNMRTAVLEAMKALIIVGNTLLMLDKDNKKKAQVYSVRDYVILRDMSGEPYHIITRDSHVVATLPEDIQMLVREKSTEKELNPDDTVEIYTSILRNTDGRFIVWQEIDAMFKVPRKLGLYTADTLPWIPLTWNLSRGHNYGTALVEEYGGDFHAHSSMAEAMVNLSAIVADIKVLVDPMGQTDVESLNDTASGTYVYGSADDISFLQLEKAQDMKFLHEQMVTYEKRIGRGFLFSAAAQRDAERVTTVEIRRDALELEGSLGGIYGRLAETLQAPLAKRESAALGDEFKDIEPTIITGLESLSRNSELDDQLLFLQDLNIITELSDEVKDWLKLGAIISALGAGRRVEYKKFLETAEQAAANRENRIAAQNPPPPPTAQPPEETF